MPKFAFALMAFCVLATVRVDIGVAKQDSVTEAIDWNQAIIGFWEIDFVETGKLWGESSVISVSDLQMAPIAPPGFSFDADHVRYGVAPNQSKYRVRNFEPASRVLSLEVFTEKGSAPIQFKVDSQDRLILDLTLSVVGPIEIVYRRKRTEKLAVAETPLSRLAGVWTLDEPLSKAMWNAQNPAEVAKRYTADKLPQIEKFKTVRFDADTVYFDGEKTAKAVKVINSDDSSIGLSSIFGGQQIELHLINADLIQLSDSRRQLVAIYQRENSQFEFDSSKQKFPVSRVAQSFLEHYVASVQPPLDDRAETIGIDGGIELNELHIERRRSAEAVVNADITNMSVELFVDMAAPYQGLAGGFLAHLTKLQPVVDDTGKILDTGKRRKGMPFLVKPVQTNTLMNKRDGRSGPAFSLRFDAPALGATRIASLAGELEVCKYTTRMIVVKDVRKAVGQPIQHPLLAGLNIIPAIKEGSFPELELQNAEERSGRILNWHLVTESAEILNPTSWSSQNMAHGYRQKIPQNVSLWIEVTDIEPGKKFKFQFRDVKFP